MKLKDINKESVELMELLEEIYMQDQNFWASVEKYIIHGIPASDEKGHWQEIRLKVRPSQMDLINGVRDKLPSGLHKSQSSLVRSLIATGCRTYFEFFKKHKGSQWKELEEILTSLNILGRQRRLQELKADVQKAMNITVNGSDTLEEKTKVIDLLSKIESKITHL